MHIISLWIGKITFVTLQLVGRRGAALPGKAVEAIDKKFLQHSLNKLNEGVIVVSGTNGKTTSTKMLTAIFRADGKKVLTNPTGSNFTRGVVSSIVQHSSWLGKLDYYIAIIELDEAYAAKFVKQYQPRISLILNVMRDQMDRFGEIDHTARLLKEVANNTTEVVVLNRDDGRVAKMGKGIKAKAVFFGVNDKLRDIFRSDDELHGDIVKNNASAVCQLEKIGDEEITTTILGNKTNFKLGLYGLYNAQNTCAVITVAVSAGVGVDIIKNTMANIKPAFGRGERLAVNGKTVILQLVKNPGGFRHALLGAAGINEDVNIIAINDDYADGRDVSWLWDVDFKPIANKIIITAGSRAADMALRLHYEDIKVKQTEQNLERALSKSLAMCSAKGTIHIYTTYTAMLSLRGIISGLAEVEKI